MCLWRSLHLLILQGTMRSSCLRLGPCECQIFSKECPVTVVNPVQGVINTLITMEFTMENEIQERK